MSEIEVMIALIGQAKSRGGFVDNNALRELVEEFDYARCGKVTGGRFMQAHIPDDKFNEFSNALKKNCTVARKNQPGL